MTGGVSFSHEVEERVSLLFIEDFYNRYSELINAIGEYLSYAHLFKQQFKSKRVKELKEELVIKIKSNLSPVVLQLEAITEGIKNSAIESEFRVIKELYNDIILSDEIDENKLKQINEKLSKFVALLFLKPVIKYIPSFYTRLRGDVE
jgi:hypothetical protein